MHSIVTASDIDTEAAEEFLQNPYKGIDLLPGIPEQMTVSIAAALLDVSEPTIKRMIEDKQITLRKSSILAYIQDKMLVNRPLKLEKNLKKKPQIAPKNPI